MWQYRDSGERGAIGQPCDIPLTAGRGVGDGLTIAEPRAVGAGPGRDALRFEGRA